MAVVPTQESGTLQVSILTMAQPYLGVDALMKGSGDMANAVASVALTGTTDTTVYLCGLIVTGTGATVALPVQVTVDGLLGGSRSFIYVFVAGVNNANNTLNFNFNPPLVARGDDVPITVTCPASGPGGLHNMVFAYGFYANPNR